MIRMTLSLLFSALLVATPVHAQLTLDDLDAAVSGRVAALSSFEDALADEDPRRALAAMQIMIEMGDPDQRRMAIRHGLYSTDLAIRSEVLRAIFNSAPALNIYMTPKGDVGNYYARDISNRYGNLKPDMSSSLVLAITGFDPETKCWTNSGNKCLVRLNADVVSLFIDRWGTLTLGNDGSLRGETMFSQTFVDVVVPLAE